MGYGKCSVLFIYVMGRTLFDIYHGGWHHSPSPTWVILAWSLVHALLRLARAFICSFLSLRSLT